MAILRLKQRADFLAAAATGAKIATAGFVLQGRNRDDAGPPRIGFTVSRKVGTAVERNRVRRRLREIVRHSDGLRPGYDYVVVGRRTALNRPFDHMIEDFKNALGRLGRPAVRQSAVRATPQRAGDPPGTRRNKSR
jgi:ribonuclease P protein component